MNVFPTSKKQQNNRLIMKNHLFGKQIAYLTSIYTLKDFTDFSLRLEKNSTCKLKQFQNNSKRGFTVEASTITGISRYASLLILKSDSPPIFIFNIVLLLPSIVFIS